MTRDGGASGKCPFEGRISQKCVGILAGVKLAKYIGFEYTKVSRVMRFQMLDANVQIFFPASCEEQYSFSNQEFQKLFMYFLCPTLH